MCSGSEPSDVEKYSEDASCNCEQNIEILFLQFSAWQRSILADVFILLKLDLEAGLNSSKQKINIEEI